MKLWLLLLLILTPLLPGCVGTTIHAGTATAAIGIIPTVQTSAPTATPFKPLEATDTLPPTQTASPVPTSTREEQTMPTKTPSDPLILTIVYNNILHDSRLASDWGFGAYIQYHNQVVLFDTGTQGRLLLNNMDILGLDPRSVQAVVLSHAHQDHTGGLVSFLEVSNHPPVYLLASFGASFIQNTSQVTDVIQSTPGQAIAVDMLTTGEVPGGIPEQALIIRTGRGLVVVTGCAHPGVVRIIEKAIELTGESVHMVIGGFHLRDASSAVINGILQDFRRLGVQKVAPSHCTGDFAIRMFAEEYGQDFLETGAGSIIIIENEQE